MPPPEPRSSTTSPGFSSASAVGLPQPSEASTAFSGRLPVSSASYRSRVMGSGVSSQHALPPQQVDAAPAAARWAASPYFSRTAVLSDDTDSMVPSPSSVNLRN